jgi:hypothetical protein
MTNSKFMTYSIKPFLVLAVLFAVSISANPSLADPPEWGPALEKQMQNIEACRILYMVNVREYRLFNHDIVEAKVQCEDGRSFDVIRRELNLPFEITPCKPIAC